MKTTILTLAIALALSLSVPAAAKVTAQQKCDSLKLTASAKLAQCRLVALAKHEKKPDETRRDEAFAKCESKFQTVYGKAELKAPEDAAAADEDQCSTYGDAASLLTYASALGGGFQRLISIPSADSSRLVPGMQHACWLSDEGGVWCAGEAADGELGDGTFANTFDVPVQPVGLDTGVAAIAAGNEHLCALLDDGSVRCWGDNDEGQIGNGQTDDVGFPVEVLSSEYGIQQIGLGGNFSCAVDKDRRVLCWGDNLYGQCGVGSSSNEVLEPTYVASLDTPVQSVHGGDDHACALTIAGDVACWGRGQSLGDGSGEDSDAPVWVVGLSEGNATQLASGDDFSCATDQDRSLLCWGRNDYGQLGDGTNEDSTVPVAVADLGAGVQMFSGGDRFACAVSESGKLFCWGRGNVGNLGNGSEDDSSTPVLVGGVLEFAGDAGFARITDLEASIGFQTACAVTSTDGRYCWGRLRWGDETASGEVSYVDVSSPELAQVFYDVDP